jgi:hypothetical protein
MLDGPGELLGGSGRMWSCGHPSSATLSVIMEVVGAACAEAVGLEVELGFGGRLFPLSPFDDGCKASVLVMRL